MSEGNEANAPPHCSTTGCITNHQAPLGIFPSSTITFTNQGCRASNAITDPFCWYKTPENSFHRTDYQTY